MANSWEKAVSALSGKDSNSDNNEELDSIQKAMLRKQREVVQDEWNNEFEKLPEDAPVEEPSNEPIPSWANWNRQADEEQIDLTEEDRVKALLVRAGMYYPQQGVVGSVNMVVEEVKILRRKLENLKKAFE